MKNKTTAINFDQEADMLYPTLNKVEELLKEYQMVPVFYEVLADYMTSQPFRSMTIASYPFPPNTTDAI